MSFFKKFFTSEKKETLDKGLDKTRSSVLRRLRVLWLVRVNLTTMCSMRLKRP